MYTSGLDSVRVREFSSGFIIFYGNKTGKNLDEFFEDAHGPNKMFAMRRSI